MGTPKRLRALGLALAAGAMLLAASARAGAAAPETTQAAPTRPAAHLAVPLLLDPTDLGLGAAVVFDRLPDARDFNDLAFVNNVLHVVMVLPDWPAGWDELQPLAQARLPEGADLIVVLPGYPPTHAAAEAWNYLRLPLRIVMVVDGPPGDRGMVFELNAIHGLERVIADMPQPSRSGFERLQRPLSFRVIR